MLQPWDLLSLPPMIVAGRCCAVLEAIRRRGRGITDRGLQ